MIIRPFQGGYTYRKLVHWSKSLNRFRFHTVVALCVFAYPIKEQLYAFFGFISYAGLVMYGSIMRPVTATLPNKPFQEMNPKNKIGFLPPSKNVIRKTFDESNAHDLYVESEKVMRFKMVNESDLVRTRALYAHPSRETNGVVEGEIFRNEQDKIVESMKVMMAEFGISKGIWKSIGEAFRVEDEIKTRKRREYLRSLETLT